VARSTSAVIACATAHRARAYETTTNPTGVTRTPFGPRRNNLHPSALSTVCTRWLKPGWEYPSPTAAAEIDPSSATRTTAHNRARSKPPNLPNPCGGPCGTFRSRAGPEPPATSGQAGGGADSPGGP
jgi:hypothetical protein